MDDNTKTAVIATLRENFPYGHEMFTDITMEEMQLHSDKNHDYAAGGHPLGNFFRVANILSQYPGLNLGDPAIVALVYAMKQVDAVLWMLSNGHEAVVEGMEGRLADIHVYAKLARIILRERELELKNRQITPDPVDIDQAFPDKHNEIQMGEDN